MDIKTFNISILMSWLIVTSGGCILNVGWGLVASGILLAIFTFALAKIAGIYTKGNN